MYAEAGAELGGSSACFAQQSAAAAEHAGAAAAGTAAAAVTAAGRAAAKKPPDPCKDPGMVPGVETGEDVIAFYARNGQDSSVKFFYCVR
jgi:hypothetical protein